MAFSLDAYSSAIEMVLALQARDISAEELLDLHRRRGARYNPLINAIVTDNPRATSEAQAADCARAEGLDAPLLGLPITIKDCISVRGLLTTGGLVERANFIDPDDAPMSERVKEAGAVIMGKTNVPPNASDWQSNNPLFGRTLNPWDRGRSPGGSTGGGAAAVAAGLTPLEFGGDFYGSIRIPAAFCGIYGHKPTLSLAPGTGHFPAGQVPNPAAAIAVVGPLARTAEDLELAMRVIAGPERDEGFWKTRLPPPRHTSLREFRVAFLPPLHWQRVEGSILAAAESLASRLCQLGIQVGKATPEEFGDLQEYHRTYLGVIAAIESQGRSKEEREEVAAQYRATGDSWLAAWADGILASAPRYLQWMAQAAAFRTAFGRFFRTWDVLVAPANIVNPFPHTDAALPGGTLLVDGKPVDYGQQTVYPGLANLTGVPATAFPAGRTETGLPIGLQAIGAYGDDLTTIRFTELLAQEFGGFEPPPGFNSAF